MSNTPTDAELDAIDMAAQAIANQNPIGTPFAWRKAYLAAFASAVLAKWGTPQPVGREPQCWCLTCKPMRIDDPSSIRMALCPTCGNKRCPKANDHRNQCSNSNEPGQKGSAYEGCGITQRGGSNAE